jgi:hypothetical protein
MKQSIGGWVELFAKPIICRAHEGFREELNPSYTRVGHRDPSPRFVTAVIDISLLFTMRNGAPVAELGQVARRNGADQAFRQTGWRPIPAAG